MNNINKLFDNFEKQLDCLDIINPIICDICGNIIPRKMKGKGYSTSINNDELIIHDKCIDKLKNR